MGINHHHRHGRVTGYIDIFGKFDSPTARQPRLRSTDRPTACPFLFYYYVQCNAAAPSVGTCRACVGGLGHTVGVIRVRVSAVHGCSPQQSQPDEQENATKFAFQFPCSIFVKLRCVEDASQSRSVPIRERNSHFAPSDREFGRRCVLPRPSFTPAGLGEIDQAFPLHPSPTRSLRSIHPAPSSACRITHLLPCPNGTSPVALMAKTKGVCYALSRSA